MIVRVILAVACVLCLHSDAFVIESSRRQHTATTRHYAIQTKEKPATNDSIDNKLDPDDTTKKYGLEVGLFESLKQKDGGETAKSLLKKYGIAYLATSIPLALVSFCVCYLLVDQGVDLVGRRQPGAEDGERVGRLAQPAILVPGQRHVEPDAVARHALHRTFRRNRTGCSADYHYELDLVAARAVRPSEYDALPGPDD